MGCKERVSLAIQHKIPDKVPKGELEIDKSLREKLLGKEATGNDFINEIKVREFLHMDIAPLCYLDRPESKVIEVKPSGEKIIEDVWKNQYLVSERTTKQIKPAIKDIKDVYKYQFPSLEIFKPDTIKRWVNETDFFVFAQLDGGFNGVYPFFGLTEFLIYSKTNPEEIRYFVNKTIDYWIELVKIIIKAEPDGILIGDDMAFKTGTLMSPSSLRELVFPAMKREVKEIKKLTGLPVFLHSDGNLNEIMDDIVDMGFDGVQSLQPSAGMNIEEIKNKYGDKLCLWGNVDLDYLLPSGKPEEIEEKVKWLIKVAGKNGGYILSTCNILTKDVPVENAIAMYETGEKYGKYKGE